MPIQNSNFLKKYLNEYFIETGTFRGESITYALEAGFNLIKSVELSKYNYDNCLEKFKDNAKVQLYNGHSEDLLWKMIKYIDKPITFWLDAHYSGCGFEDGEKYITEKGNTFSSIVSELKIIKEHHIKEHIILIDDKRDFGTMNFDYVTEAKIRELLLDINPNYNIFYDTGDPSRELFKDDVLVSRI